MRDVSICYCLLLLLELTRYIYKIWKLLYIYTYAYAYILLYLSMKSRKRKGLLFVISVSFVFHQDNRASIVYSFKPEDININISPLPVYKLCVVGVASCDLVCQLPFFFRSLAFVWFAIVYLFLDLDRREQVISSALCIYVPRSPRPRCARELPFFVCQPRPLWSRPVQESFSGVYCCGFRGACARACLDLASMSSLSGLVVVCDYYPVDPRGSTGRPIGASPCPCVLFFSVTQIHSRMSSLCVVCALVPFVYKSSVTMGVRTFDCPRWSTFVKRMPDPELIVLSQSATYQSTIIMYAVNIRHMYTNTVNTETLIIVFYNHT